MKVSLLCLFKVALILFMLLFHSLGRFGLLNAVIRDDGTSKAVVPVFEVAS